MDALHDMHCHLNFMANAEDVVADARDAGTLLFANTVTMDEYRCARKRFADAPNVRVGLGTHPWWADSRFDFDRFQALASKTRFIGEIGLDFGKRHQENRQEQLDAFVLAANVCARQTDKLISLHAVHAASEVLDILQQSAALDTCTCVFHWFSGSSDQLKRAIEAGCFFSVGPRMLATGKGREYVKAIPAGQLLLETDAPPAQGQRYSYDELRAELQHAAEQIAALKGPEAIERIALSTQALLC